MLRSPARLDRRGEVARAQECTRAPARTPARGALETPCPCACAYSRTALARDNGAREERKRCSMFDSGALSE